MHKNICVFFLGGGEKNLHAPVIHMVVKKKIRFSIPQEELLTTKGNTQ